MDPINVNVPCYSCEKSTLLANVQFETLDLNQRWEDVAPLLERMGWGVRENDLGNLTGFCPTCLAARDALPAYTGVAAACPKCADANVKVSYCRGGVPACSYRGTREHLHRECECCGYDWIEACADASSYLVVKGQDPHPEASEASYGADSNIGGARSAASG